MKRLLYEINGFKLKCMIEDRHRDEMEVRQMQRAGRVQNSCNIA